MTTKLVSGDYAILRGGEICRLINLKPGLSLKLGRLGTANAGSLIGQYFDSTYIVDETAGKKFVRVSDDMMPDLDAEMQAEDANDLPSNLTTAMMTSATAAAAAAASAADNSTDASSRDNRALVDNNASQALKNADLRELKDKEGVNAIVTHLIQNSATFSAKTAFSQEKYIKRKKIKYNNVFRVERPTVASLCELWAPSLVRSFNETEPNKFIRLRVDAVAQILSLGNVFHNASVLMYEKTNGFMCAAALDRMSENGRVYHVMPPNACANVNVAEILGLSQIKERWRVVHLAHLIPNNKSNAAAAAAAAAVSSNSTNAESGAATTELQPSDRVRMELRKDEVDALVSSGSSNSSKGGSAGGGGVFDSLIVCDDEDPSIIAAALFPFVKLSGQIVVYSPFAQQLFDLHGRLKDDVVGARIQETWLREIQVLPNRTHPHVHMSHTGGYIFSATKVQPISVVRPPEARYRAMREQHQAKNNMKSEEQQPSDAAAAATESGTRREREQ